MKKSIVVSIMIAVFAFSIIMASAQLANSPWPGYMQNNKHTGLSPYETNIKNPKIKWKFNAGHGIETGATIGSDGTIYFGTFKNNLFALNPDGSEKWRFTRPGEEFRSTPTIAKDGTIYFGAVYDLRKVHNILHDTDMDYGRPKVYALNPDGSVKWEFITGGILGGTYASPTIGPDGTIYMGAGGSKMTMDAVGGDGVWAINPDGTKKWFFKTNEAFFTAMAIADDGTIYASCADSNLYAINPDGTEKWRFTRNIGSFSVFDGTPTVGADGTIYIANTEKTLFAVTPDGKEKWNFKVLDNPFEATPTIGPDGTIYFGVIDQSEKDKNIYAITPEGKLKWKFETGNGVFGSPAIDKNGILFFGSYDKNVYSLSPEGKELWRLPLKGGIVVSPTIGADGTIYIGSWDNHLYAITNGEDDDVILTKDDNREVGIADNPSYEQGGKALLKDTLMTIYITIPVLLILGVIVYGIRKKIKKNKE